MIHILIRIPIWWFRITIKFFWRYPSLKIVPSPTTAFGEYWSNTLPTQPRHIEHMEFGVKEKLTNWQLWELRNIFKQLSDVIFAIPNVTLYSLSKQILLIASLKIINGKDSTETFPKLRSTGMNHHLLKLSFYTPLQSRVLGGIYCFQPVCPSVIHFNVLLNNLHSFCLVLIKFAPHLNHKT